MDRHALRNQSFWTRSLIIYIYTFFLISSFAIAAPSTSPFERGPVLRLERRTESETRTTYSPSSTRSSASATTSSSTDDDYVPPVPRAFDTSAVLTNFTSTGCQPFFQTFLNNETFINCFPLSFFVQNSKSWFDITKHGIVPVTQALTASCSVDSAMCNNVMNELGRQMLEAENCGQDFKLRNPTVIQAYASFISYPVMFAAGCQRSETGFCYADAITNSSNAADTYVYLMPLGIAIPGGARLTCSTCLQKTMKIYSAAAVNTSLPISSTYVSGANLINLGCGPGFVNTSIAEAQIGAAVSLNSRTWISTISIVAILSMMFL
ncbi:hypothetical protein ABW19_dt0200161 [Dactylella cylindrospora]|nr:hypothetical protein ABW19_dt0200161 [Dactylella cylindrospora]